MSEYLQSGNIVSNMHCRSDHPSISPWLDEQIWGHRIWDNQSPWLLFLEFLTVAEACNRENRLFDECGVSYPLQFRPYQRLYLRNILFKNGFVDGIDATRSDGGRLRGVDSTNEHRSGWGHSTDFCVSQRQVFMISRPSSEHFVTLLLKVTGIGDGRPVLYFLSDRTVCTKTLM